MRQSKPMTDRRPVAYGGIDPDTKGGMCVYVPDTHHIEYFNFPGLQNKRDLKTHMRDITRAFNIRYVGLEKQGLRPTDGPKGYGTLMGAYHTWEMVLVQYDLPYEMIMAKAWQDKMTKKSDGKDTKDRAFNVSRRMFPEHHFMNVGKKGQALTTRNQGIADATMIAVYTRRFLS